MESVLSRYKNLIWLVVVLFLQVLGLAMQVKKSGNSEQTTRLIRIWAVDAVTPLERSLVWVQNGTSDIWHNYFYLRGVRKENRQLKDEIEHLRLEQVRLAEDAAQARRLQTILGFKEQYISRTVAAQVIGTSGSDHSRIVYIDKGKNAGIEPDMAVITADGIVGKVLLAYPSLAQVLLINDESSGVGALLQQSRLQGVLRGSPSGEVVLERVMTDEAVAAGEPVLTSGGDQIFPKGLPIGTISKVGKGKDLFLNIKIKPAADLSKLEEVLVLVEKQERPAAAMDAPRLRASDILADRLPSVPDKPPANAAPGHASATGSASAANQTKKSAAQPSTPVAGTAKPNTPASSAKPAGTLQGNAKPASPPVRRAQPAQPSTAVSDSPALSPTTSEPASIQTQPDGPQATPANTQPKPLAPITPPAQPTNPQPPADDNPH